MRIKIKDGLIYLIENVVTKLEYHPINAPFADEIAYANGFQCAEQFVKKYPNKVFDINTFNYKIKL